MMDGPTSTVALAVAVFSALAWGAPCAAGGNVPARGRASDSAEAPGSQRHASESILSLERINDAPSAALVVETASQPQATGSTPAENGDGDDATAGGFWLFPQPAPLNGSLATDRPGFSDTFALVPRGHFHLEGGYTFTYDREGPDRDSNHLLGEWSLRTGLTDDFELRIKWSGWSFTESFTQSTSRWAGRRITVADHDDGGTDMSLGFKSPLFRQDGLMPNVSVIPAISLPTGKGSKSSNDVDPEIRLAWNYALNDSWSVYGVGLATVLSDGEGRFFQSGASLATYYQLTPNLGWFVEYFGLYPPGRGVPCQHNIDSGPVFLIGDNFQIDVRAGFGLNDDAPDFFTGIGFGWRM